MNKRQITEGRLREALQRLLDGRPVRVKLKGNITLNKINNEAGLGNSYVHKFPEFVEYANSIIKQHNADKQKIIEGKLSALTVDLSEIETLRLENKRLESLKNKYRDERNDHRFAKSSLEALNNTLMFRVYELQEELRHYKVKFIKSSIPK
jgi:hypothetical protein